MTIQYNTIVQICTIEKTDFYLCDKHLYFFCYVAKFKEICPGGMGYTVLPNPPINKPVTISQEPIDLLPPQALPTTARAVEAFGKPEEIIPGESLPCNIISAYSVG